MGRAAASMSSANFSQVGSSRWHQTHLTILHIETRNVNTLLVYRQILHLHHPILLESILSERCSHWYKLGSVAFRPHSISIPRGIKVHEDELALFDLLVPRLRVHVDLMT